VGGFEIRPVTAADVQALAEGRCTCGSEDEGPVEGFTPDGRRLPVGAPSNAGEGVFDFAANTDGPWPLPWSAFVRELDRLAAADKERQKRGDVPPSQVPVRDIFVMGAWSAMRWTLGASAKPPFWQGPPVLVSNAVIERVLGSAGHLATHGLGDLRWYAEGVRAWLRWITGGIPAIAYPPTQ
jgi:hypothetical protein